MSEATLTAAECDAADLMRRPCGNIRWRLAVAATVAASCMQCVEAARRGLCVRGAVVFPAAALVTSASRLRGGMHNALTHTDSTSRALPTLTPMTVCVSWTVCA